MIPYKYLGYFQTFDCQNECFLNIGPFSNVQVPLDKLFQWERLAWKQTGSIKLLTARSALAWYVSMTVSRQLCQHRIAELSMPSFAFASSRRGQENWLQLDHRVLEHDLPKKPGPAILHFAVRYVWAHPAFTSFFVCLFILFLFFNISSHQR